MTLLTLCRVGNASHVDLDNLGQKDPPFPRGQVTTGAVTVAHKLSAIGYRCRERRPNGRVCMSFPSGLRTMYYCFSSVASIGTSGFDDQSNLNVQVVPC